MKCILFVFTFCCCSITYGKEWKSLKSFQKATNLERLTNTDWLKSDRKRNTITWKNANAHNLKHNLSKEYMSMAQRRDFYNWIHSELENRGHEVLWPRMAHLISAKLHMVDVFPYNIFIKKKIKVYSRQGSEVVFDNAFPMLSEMMGSDVVLKGEEALKWDQDILYKEQYIWLEEIYASVDAKTLKTIDRIAKGRFLYGLVVPKAIRFEGDIAVAKMRYNYAVHTLREYCKQN